MQRIVSVFISKLAVFSVVLTLLVLLIVSCSKDDLDSCNLIEEEEILSTEDRYNRDLATLQLLSRAYEEGEVVKCINKIEKGLEIKLSNGQSIDVRLDKQQIGGGILDVELSQDNNYVWTINGEWLYDPSGNPLYVNSNLPLVSYKDDGWYYSINNGVDWTKINKEGIENPNKQVFSNYYIANNSVGFVLASEEVIKLATEINTNRTVPLITPENYSYKCIHHDNFSRVMPEGEIGKNCGSTYQKNNYEIYPTNITSDDLTVNGYALWRKNTSRVNNFSFRKIVASPSSNFMLEVNAPTNGNMIGFAYNLVDEHNFSLIRISTGETSTYRYYDIFLISVDSDAETVVWSSRIRQREYELLQLFFLNDCLYVYWDDEFTDAVYVGSIGHELYLCSRKNANYRFDFVNLFDVTQRLVWNPNYQLDAGVMDIIGTTINANPGRYELNSDVTNWSNYSEHFVLFSNDAMLNNGKRAERRIDKALLETNLRTLYYSFDVYFPSTVADDREESLYHDTFLQLHDRESRVSRNSVPFTLNIQGGNIYLWQISSTLPMATSSNLIKQFVGQICEIKKNKWQHFDIYVKERYDREQHPHMWIKIDGVKVYESRMPNCFNDIAGTEAQYGVYKNNWYYSSFSERYFDNMIIEY